MRHNPLDPEAFSYDALPHRIRSRPMLREDYLGVHTTGSLERATIYAVNKAQVTPDSIGLIYVLDMEGLDPLPDIDAVVQEESHGWMVAELLDEEMVQAAFRAGDVDELYEAVHEYIDLGALEGEGPNAEYTWTDCAVSEVDYQDGYRAGLVLQSMTPDELYELLVAADQAGGFPATFWADTVQQHRYLTGVGIDRVIEVLAVRPVRQDLWGEGDDDPPRHEQDWPEEDEDAPQIFTNDEFGEENWLPDMVTIWSSGREVDDPEYHGTDLTRAQTSFPELSLANPWPYTQELAL